MAREIELTVQYDRTEKPRVRVETAHGALVFHGNGADDVCVSTPETRTAGNIEHETWDVNRVPVTIHAFLQPDPQNAGAWRILNNSPSYFTCRRTDKFGEDVSSAARKKAQERTMEAVATFMNSPEGAVFLKTAERARLQEAWNKAAAESAELYLLSCRKSEEAAKLALALKDLTEEPQPVAL